jgi:hypothetical protein
MANGFTGESVRFDQRLYLPGTGNVFDNLATIWLRQSIYRERFKRELLVDRYLSIRLCLALPGARLGATTIDRICRPRYP